MKLELIVPFDRMVLLIEHTRSVTSAAVTRIGGWEVTVQCDDNMSVLHALYVATAPMGCGFEPASVTAAVLWHHREMLSVVERLERASQTTLVPLVQRADETIVLDRIRPEPAPLDENWSER